MLYKKYDYCYIILMLCLLYVYFYFIFYFFSLFLLIIFSILQECVSKITKLISWFIKSSVDKHFSLKGQRVDGIDFVSHMRLCYSYSILLYLFSYAIAV